MMMQRRVRGILSESELWTAVIKHDGQDERYCFWDQGRLVLGSVLQRRLVLG
jgi:hypothetical protein